MTNRYPNSQEQQTIEGLELSHDERHDDEGRADPCASARSGHDDSGAATAADSGAESSDERRGDRRVGGEDGAVDQTRDAVDEIGDVVDAEIIDDNDPKVKRLVEMSLSWSGELPHPGDLERYEALCPGITSRLLDQKDQSLAIVASRTRTVERAVDAEATTQETLAVADMEALRRGQWLSWSISMAAIVASIVGLSLGYPVALAALIVPIVQVSGKLIRTVTDGHERLSAPAHPPKKNDE